MSFTRGARMGGFPKPGEIRGDMPGRHSREGWIHLTDHTSVNLQGKQYRDMKEWSRPCAVCGAKFSVFEKVGTIDANSRFSNRTCDAHRNLLPAVEKGYIVWSASHGGMIAGTACVGSVAGTAVQDGATAQDTAEVVELKRENKEYADAIIEHIAQRGVYVRRIEALEKELAPYKLQPAMEAAKPAEQPKPAFDRHAWLAAEIARKDAKPLPWK